ncbi:hypothetical protein B0H21DRAFT_876842 [Amylocystis lapponica]|nr:hypothetical protein B0H21DRAFT_876842 [Amylocystis lapponica]
MAMAAVASQGNSVKPIFTDSVLHIDLICELIFSCCSPAALVQTAATCRVAKESVHSYIQYAFNINRRLSRYFSDPLAFRSLQARTATLISGSFALQFFDRSFYPTSDLDLYVHMRHRREVGRWLLGAGYAFAPTPYQYPDFEVAVADPLTVAPGGIYDMPGIACIFNFTTAARTGGGTLKVILGFHSTCVMNVLSFEKAYCLYPRTTLEERRSLVSASCRGQSERRPQGLDKYAVRGWTIVARLPPQDAERRDGAFRLGWRWIDDNASWVVALDTAGVARAPAPNASSGARAHDPVAVCNWQLRYSAVGGAVMQFGVAKGGVLRYVYLVTDEGLLGHLTRVLSAKIRVEQAKADLKLEDWNYCDDELPRICREHIREVAERKLVALR